MSMCLSFCVKVVFHGMNKFTISISLPRGWRGKPQALLKYARVIAFKTLICFFFYYRNLCYRDFWHVKRFSTALERSKIQTDFFFFFAIWLHLSFECLTVLNVFIDFVPLSLFSSAISQWSGMMYANKNAHGSFYPYSNSECKICLLHYWALFC